MRARYGTARQECGLRRVLDEPLRVAGGPGAYSDHAGVFAEIEIDQTPDERAPVPPAAFDRARKLLREGREGTLTRRRHERLLGGASILATALAIRAARRPAFSRRRFLRAATWGLAGLSATSAIGLFTLAERFIPQELAGYDSIGALLERMAEAAGAAP